MEYLIDVYLTDAENNYRYALGSLSEKTLFVIGLNPSTACDKTPDNTIRKVMGLAEYNGYTSFIMLNLYPKRDTYPDDLPDEDDKKILEENFSIIYELIKKEKKANILLAWGNNIFSRAYLLDSIKMIYKKLESCNPNWFQVGTLTKRGQPRHPLYVSYQAFTPIDMDDYLKTL